MCSVEYIFHYYSPLCFAFINSLQCNIKCTNQRVTFLPNLPTKIIHCVDMILLTYFTSHLLAWISVKKYLLQPNRGPLFLDVNVGIDLCWYLHYYSHFNSKLIYQTNWLITLPSIFDRMISRFSRGFCICNSSDIVLTLLYS